VHQFHGRPVGHAWIRQRTQIEKFAGILAELWSEINKRQGVMSKSTHGVQAKSP
jgi:hypothetical protein